MLLRWEKKIRISNRVSHSQPPGHESDTFTTMSPERALLSLYFQYVMVPCCIVIQLAVIQNGSYRFLVTWCLVWYQGSRCLACFHDLRRHSQTPPPFCQSMAHMFLRFGIYKRRKYYLMIIFILRVSLSIVTIFNCYPNSAFLPAYPKKDQGLYSPIKLYSQKFSDYKKIGNIWFAKINSLAHLSKSWFRLK